MQPPVGSQPVFCQNAFTCQPAPALIIPLTDMGKTDNSQGIHFLQLFR
jgi:hypothetical protein